MMKQGILAGLVIVSTLLLTQSAGAQTAAKKAPSAAGPTKVTGEGTKIADGLQYWDIKVGSGRTADRGDTVKAHYKAWLTNGKKFDRSVGGPPFSFRIGAHQVIQGWEEE